MFEFLLTDEQKKIQAEARELVASIPKQMILDMDADKITFPTEFLRAAAHKKLFGCRYPKELGGRDMDWVTTCMVMEEVGTLGYIFACTFGIGSELVCDAIVKHGSDLLKEKYVKPLLKGDLFAAECLTEPRGGSDFFGTTTSAEKKNGYYVLNGQKRFIVGAEGADFFLVYARTAPPPAESHKALTCFIVDRNSDIHVKYLYGLMGCRGGGAGRVIFDNVKVPEENIVGRLHGAYDVFNTMMIPERLGTAAMTIGAAKPALDIATAYTSKRKAFGQVINTFQGVGFQVAEAAMLLDASRSMVYTTAKAVDAGSDSNLIRRMVSQTKKFVTESSQKVVHNAMQVMGGIGYTNVFPIERIYRDLRLASIWTGTNEVMSAIIANEWYKEYHKIRKHALPRDYEKDSSEADAADEKIYE